MMLSDLPSTSRSSYDKLIKKMDGPSVKKCGRVFRRKKTKLFNQRLVLKKEKMDMVHQLCNPINQLSSISLIGCELVRKVRWDNAPVVKKDLFKTLPTLKCSTGPNIQIIQQLTLMPEKQIRKYEICTLVFEEMPVYPQLSYDLKNDYILGFQDVGNNKRMPAFADRVYIFSLHGLYMEYIQHVGLVFTKGPIHKSDLANILKEFITQLVKIKFEIVAVACKNQASHVEAFNILKNETREFYDKAGKQCQVKGFEIQGREIVIVYDVPTLFVDLRNTMMCNNITYVKDASLKTVKWSHIKQAYASDENPEEFNIFVSSKELRVLLNKRSDSVHVATKIVSHSNALFMNYLVRLKKINDEAFNTAVFLYFMHKLFYSLNGKTVRENSKSEYSCAVRRNSLHWSFWKSALDILKSMKLGDSKSEEMSTFQSLKMCWIETLESCMYLSRMLLTKYGFKYVHTSLFNLDSSKKSFLNLIQQNTSPLRPTCYNLYIAIESTLLVDLSAIDSCPLRLQPKFLGKFLKLIKEPNPPSSDDVPSYKFPKKLQNFVKNQPKMSYDAYKSIMNVVVQIVLESFGNCEICRSDITSDTIKKRSFTPTLKFHIFLNHSIEMCIKELPGICHKIDIADALNELISQKLDPSFLSCKQHRQELFEYALGVTIIRYILKWCDWVNSILNGDCKLDKGVIDPMTVKARIYYQNKMKKNTGKN